MRLNEAGILCIHSCCESRSQLCSYRTCLAVSSTAGRGRAGAEQASHADSIPVQQGHGQQWVKSPGRTPGKPEALTIAQQTCTWLPPRPVPDWGCRGLKLPAKSSVTAIKKLGRAESLIPPPSPDPASHPCFGRAFLGSELKKRKAQLSAVIQIT